MTLACEHKVELRGQHRGVATQGASDSVAIQHIVSAPTICTRTMSGRKRHSFVEEEDRCPAMRRHEWLTSAPELRDADDPERAVVMPHDLLVGVDETAPIARQQTPSLDRVKIAPRISSIAPRHLPSLAVAGIFSDWRHDSISSVASSSRHDVVARVLPSPRTPILDGADVKHHVDAGHPRRDPRLRSRPGGDQSAPAFLRHSRSDVHTTFADLATDGGEGQIPAAFA